MNHDTNKIDNITLSNLFHYVHNGTMEAENAAKEASMSFEEFRDAMSNAGYDVHNVRKKYKVVTYEDLANSKGRNRIRRSDIIPSMQTMSLILHMQEQEEIGSFSCVVRSIRGNGDGSFTDEMWCDFFDISQKTLDTVRQVINENPDWNDYEVAEEVLLVQEQEEYTTVQI